ncbi:MAG: hypothetical protein KGS45_13875 [Planctomycetes bacterium]|nr:hypothetical protein [Planctomycetota bacterium]
MRRTTQIPILYRINTSHLFALEPADRTLLQTAITRRFDLHALIDPASPHPAQHDLFDLLIWFDEPHIVAACETYIRITTRADTYAASLDIPNHAAALKRLLACNLDLLSRNEFPVDPTDHVANERAISRNRHIARETRLILNTISKLFSVPTTAAPRATSPRSRTKPASSTHDAPSDFSPQSTDSPTTPNQAATRTNPPGSNPVADLKVALHTELNHLNALLAAAERDPPADRPAESPSQRLDNPQSALLQTTS